MRVQCGNCGSAEHVTIGDQQYCTNCGAIVTGSPAPAAPAAEAPVTPPAAPVQAKSFSDIAGPGQVAPIVASEPEKATIATPRKQLSDIVAPAPSLDQPAATVTPSPTPATPPMLSSSLDLAAPSNAGFNPAKSFHAAPVAISLQPVAAPSSEPNPTEVPTSPVFVSTPEPVAVTTAPTPAPITTVVAAEPAAPAVESSSMATSITKDQRAAARLERAAAVPKSDLIAKLGGSTIAQPPTSSPSVDTSSPGLAPAPAQPAPSTLIMPSTVQPQALAEDLSNAAASHHAAMQALLDAPDDHPSLMASPKPAGLLKSSSTAAAALAIAVMGGYIWIKNYPNMELKVASGKAGVEASMPGYVPSGYSLNGPVAYQPGEISLSFKSNAGGGPLTITQRRTNWNSQTLLDSYVSSRSSNYVAVDNQGLTVYMYNGNQASWVNHGIWYAIEGNTLLGRDQILRIVDSL